MPDPDRLTPSLLRRGVRVSTGAATRSLRALDGDRRGALGAAVAMLLVLLAPWYEIVATAPGADGRRHALRQSLSGWASLSQAAVVCAIVAVAVVAGLIVRGAAVVDGLGADGRRAARARLDGGLIAGGGTLATLLVLWALLHHPGPGLALAGARSAETVRFGLVLGLLAAIALAALGARIALAADEPPPRALPRRPPRTALRRPGVRRSTGRTSRSGEELPQFDFAVDAPARTRPDWTGEGPPRR